LSKGDGSFTPHALARIEGVFQMYDRDQDGMWDVAEWNDVNTALGEDGAVDLAQMKQLAGTILSSFLYFSRAWLFPSFL
jgi:hypothetical protein